MAEATPDFESLPVEERLSHKVWKARLSAYEELTNQFKLSASEEDACFAPFLADPDLLKKAALDSNAVAQEKAVVALCAFVEFGGKPTAKTREVVMPAAVEKCFGSTRAGTKNQALQLALLYTEVCGSAEGIVQDIIPSLKAKQPKLVAGCVAALKDLMKNFGPKVVPLQLVLKQLPAIFAHADKTVRSEGQGLVQETYRFIGPAVEPFLSDLKPVQVKELQESFAALDEKGEGKGTAKQLRFTKDQARDMAIKEAETTLSGEAGAEEPEAQAAEEEFDAHALLEAVDLRKKLPDGFFEHVASSKWKERKEEALDPLLATLTATPKLADEDYTDVVTALAKRMPDANVACVTVAAQCIAALASGLRMGFAKYKQIVAAPVFERLKEKKQTVVDALASALDATARASSLSEFIEDVSSFAVHKNPQVKCETFRFLVRCLKETKTAPSPAEVKTLSATQIKGMSDSFEPTRAAAMEGLGTLAKIVGERTLIKELESLDDIKKAKVKEFMDKAEVKCKGGASKPAAAAPPPAARSAAPPQARPAQKPKARPTPIETESASPPPVPSSPQPSSQPPAAAVKRPAPSKPPAPAAAAAPKKPAPVAAPAAKAAAAAAPRASASEPLRYKMSQEEAEAQADGILPADHLAGLSSSNWKARLEAIDGLHAWIQGEGADVEPELVVRVLSKKPGWKESNFQVFSKVFGLAQLLSEQSTSWSKACSAIIVPPASDKLGDMKIKKSASDLLLVLAEKSSLQFVLSQAYEPMTKQKAPKAQAEAIAWVDQALRDFGTAGIAVRDLIEFLKAGLKSSNPAVRTSATKTIVTLKIFIGGAVKDFLQDVNPQLLATIEKEFARVEGESPPEPTRTSADLAAPPAPSAGAAGKKGAGASSAVDPMDELYPRVDLDRILSSNLLASCNDGNWKTRKESMEQVQGILEANKRYKPGVGSIGAVLKMRLLDSNKVVQNLALDITARIASGMNQPFDKHVKILGPAVMQVLSDQKAGTRQAGTNTLTSIAQACGIEPLIAPTASSLETSNPLLRKDLLVWLDSQLQQSERSPDLAILTSSLLSCLEDRSAEVRKAATAIIPRLVSSVGYSFVADKASALKPASKTTVLPLLEAARGDSNIAEPAASAAVPPSLARSAAASPPPVKKAAATSQRNVASPTPKPAEPSTSRPARPAAAGSLASSLSRPASAAGKALRTSAMPSRPLTPTRPASVDPQDAAPRPRIGQSVRRPAAAQPAGSPAASTSRPAATGPASPVPAATASTTPAAAQTRRTLRPASSRMSLGGASGLQPPASIVKGSALARPTSSLNEARDVSKAAPRRSLVPPKEDSDSHSATAKAAVPKPSSPPRRRMPTTAPVTFNEIVTENSASSVDALKTVQKDIDHRASEIMPMADDLVRAVSLQMRTAFDGLDPTTSGATLRLCKHLMQTLSAFFDNRQLAKQVSKDALVVLLAELTRRLLETADNTSSEAITSLSKVLNMVLIRIFHNSDRSVCFGALFTVLEDVTIDLRELEGRDLQQRAKYAELVMKCLWKISKSAKESLEDGSLQLKRLLLDLDGFLTAVPPAEWRRRAADGVALGDMPLRTCKTILQQVVTVFGRRALQELEDMDMADTSFVGAYLNRLLQGQHSNTDPRPVAKSAQVLKATDESQSRSPPATGTPTETQSPASQDDRSINQQLKEIFDAIGQPETSKQGITQLWEFRQDHPEAETRIQSWIDATGKHFKSYLERAMTNISADRGVSTPASPAIKASHSRQHIEGLPTLSHKSSSAGLARGTSATTAASANGNGRSRVASPGPSTERLANLQSLFGYGAAGSQGGSA